MKRYDRYANYKVEHEIAKLWIGIILLIFLCWLLGNQLAYAFHFQRHLGYLVSAAMVGVVYFNLVVPYERRNGELLDKISELEDRLEDAEHTISHLNDELAETRNSLE